jgi:hypothetical protein
MISPGIIERAHRHADYLDRCGRRSLAAELRQLVAAASGPTEISLEDRLLRALADCNAIVQLDDEISHWPHEKIMVATAESKQILGLFTFDGIAAVRRAAAVIAEAIERL